MMHVADNETGQKSTCLRLWAEFFTLFLGLPSALYFYGTRWNVHLCLWLACGYAAAQLHCLQGFSWRRTWQGDGWPVAQRKIAAMRFVLATAVMILLTGYLMPERLFMFPMQRPGFFLVVMVLYPLLSALPQELMFRSYFFYRYARLFPHWLLATLVNAACFGFIHVVFHNFVSPALAFVAGLFFVQSYRQHRSLKWAGMEHAAYGLMVFAVGIGKYFFIGGGSQH